MRGAANRDAGTALALMLAEAEALLEPPVRMRAARAFLRAALLR